MGILSGVVVGRQRPLSHTFLPRRCGVCGGGGSEEYTLQAGRKAGVVCGEFTHHLSSFFTKTASE